MTDQPHRLPATAVPRRYDLELHPDLDAASFTGEVRIALDLSESSDRLVLHAVDLEIDAAWVCLATADHDGEELVDATATIDPASEQVTFTPARVLDAGPVTLHVRFRGVLNDQLLGFYRSTFSSADPDTGAAVEHTLAVTQFESTHARRAFPCFDEPALKAVFAITLVVPAQLFAVSNSAEVSRTPEPSVDGSPSDLVRIVFADTMVMSTYLVAFVVGPLEATGARMVEGIERPIPLRVVHPPGQGHLCEFALDVAAAGLRFYEEYYGLAYPGDKVDLVAVPDFAFGAMENLGCITFREVLLLVDPAAATQPELQRVADVINHELAHMWFGDLVTMKWWNGIWLNEAFATFMEVTATDAFRPEWDVWTTFGLARAAAFDTDALRSTRPIEYEVVSAADAEGMFDILTYEKGASVVRMLEQYLGAEVFRRGISAYLQRHSYGVTETTDLWDALEEISGEPVRRIMDEWIFRGGHPLVSVEATERGVRLSQQRFRYVGADDAAATGAPAGERWPTPLVLSADDAEPTRLLLEDDVEVDLGGTPSRVQANVAGNGFFRVALDDVLRRALAEDAGATPLERFVLLDDTWAAFFAGLVDRDAVVDLLRAMASTETDPSVWRRISGITRELHRLAARADADATAVLAVELAELPLEQLDRAIDAAAVEVPDTALSRQQEVRGILFSLLGTTGAHGPTRDRARRALAEGATDASLRAAAIEVVASSATPAEHRDLEQQWRDASTPQEELRYLNALVDTEDPSLFDHVLELTATEVRTQNAPYLLRRAIAHPTLGPRAWEFVATNWPVLTARFPSNSLPRMLEGIRSLTGRTTATEVQAFLSSAELPSGDRQVGQHVERMWVTVAAAERVRAGRVS
ncbi:MAG: M1 family metallopeptidase [Microthrixaceae bacterium]